MVHQKSQQRKLLALFLLSLCTTGKMDWCQLCQPFSFSCIPALEWSEKWSLCTTAKMDWRNRRQSFFFFQYSNTWMVRETEAYIVPPKRERSKRNSFNSKTLSPPAYIESPLSHTLSFRSQYWVTNWFSSKIVLPRTSSTEKDIRSPFCSTSHTPELRILMSCATA